MRISDWSSDVCSSDLFDDATFARSAAALDNPAHVRIVIHNYRWRLGLAEGEPRYDDLERRLAGFPDIAVPTITLEGDANGAPHPDPSVYAKKFSGRYEHRLIEGGVGHNLPQEAPQEFAAAVRSEEHTSELQSLMRISYAVFCSKKKN